MLGEGNLINLLKAVILRDMTSSVLLWLVGEWTGHHWQDPGRACSYAEEHKARGDCLSDCGSSGGGLSTSRAGKLVILSRRVIWKQFHVLKLAQETEMN